MNLTFTIPNQLILDVNLPKSARCVGMAIYAHRSPMGVLHKSLDEIGELSGCAVGTVRGAIDALIAAGYISRRRHRYRDRDGKLRYGKTEYCCNLMMLEEGYTKVPRSLVRRGLRHSALCVAAYLCYAAGSKRRAYPSIREICAATHAARSTVCEAIRAIRELPELLVRRCKTVRGDYTRSSYILCHVAQAVVSASETAAEAVAAIFLPRRRKAPKSRTLAAVLRKLLDPILAPLRELLLDRGVVRFLTG